MPELLQGSEKTGKILHGRELSPFGTMTKNANLYSTETHEQLSIFSG
jgi:hypothetical protein